MNPDEAMPLDRQTRTQIIDQHLKSSFSPSQLGFSLMRRPRVYSARLAKYAGLSQSGTFIRLVSCLASSPGILLSRKHLHLRHNPIDIYQKVERIMQEQCPAMKAQDCLIASEQELVEYENALRKRQGYAAVSSSSPDWTYLLGEKQKQSLGRLTRSIIHVGHVMSFLNPMSFHFSSDGCKSMTNLPNMLELLQRLGSTMCRKIQTFGPAWPHVALCLA